MQLGYLFNIKNEKWFTLGIPDISDKQLELIQRKQPRQQIDISEKEKEREKFMNSWKKKLQILDGLYIDLGLSRQERLMMNRWVQRAIEYDHNDGYFKSIGSLNLNHDFYCEKIQKIMIISFQENPMYEIYRRSAKLCERINQNKQKPFKLDIIVGKIILSKHPLQHQEDKLIQQLKQQITMYQQKSEKAVIPHCRKLISVITNEINNLEMLELRPQEQIMILQNEQKEQEKIMQEEVSEIEEICKEITSLWLQIQDHRQQHDGYSLQNYELKFKKDMNIDGQEQVEYVLEKVGKYDEEKIKDEDKKRIKKIQSQKLQLILKVNNKIVRRSAKVNLQFPEFEAHFFTKFELQVYSKPSSIYLEIHDVSFCGSNVLDTVQLDIPGEKANSITSSETITKFVNFQQGFFRMNQNKLQNYQKELRNQKQLLEKQQKLEEKEAQKKKKEQEKNKKEEEQQNLKEDEEEDKKEEEDKGEHALDKMQDDNKEKNLEKEAEQKVKEKQMQQEEAVLKASKYIGSLSYLAEWQGFGPKMPPEKLENLIYGNVIEKKDKQELVWDPDVAGFHFDVNDPQNFAMLQRLQKQKHQEGNSSLLYLLPCHDYTSRRQKLLKIRCRETHLDVPTCESQIQNDDRLINLIIQEEKVNQIEEDQQKFDFNQDIDQNLRFPKIQHYQNKDSQFRIQLLKKKLVQKSLEYKLKKKQNIASGLQLDNLVDEFFMSKNISDFFKKFKEALKQQRKLMPKPTKYVVKKANDFQKLNFKVYVNHGQNVPVRNHVQTISRKQEIMEMLRNADQHMYTMENMQRKKRENDEKEDQTSVKSNLEIKLVRNLKQENMMMSKMSQGPNPTYNSDINGIQILSKGNHFSVSELSELNDQKSYLQITLFDNKETYQPKQNLNKLTYLINRYYLGSFQIPLSTILQQQTLNYTFKIQRPLLIFGYHILEDDIMKNKNLEDKFMTPTVPTTVNMSISLDPHFQLPENNNEKFMVGGTEDKELLAGGQKWLQNKIVNKKWPDERNIKLWGEDINQASYFFFRFCTKHKPPFDVPEEEDDSIEKAARFVSLIPFKNDQDTFDDLPDIFCNTQEFIDLQGGDYEEHAISLRNYFDYIDNFQGRSYIKSFVLLGNAVPEGKTFYVLRASLKLKPGSKDKYEQIQAELWNPKTGDAYNVNTNTSSVKFLFATIATSQQILHDKHDLACPLQSVGCIFNDENIWINTQKECMPQKIDWNIMNKKLWTPFLDEKMKKQYFKDGIKTIQPLELKYEETKPEYVLKLKFALQNNIKNNIRRLREEFNLQTVFNTTQEEFIENNILRSLEVIKYTCRMSGLNSKLRQGGENEKENKAINDIGEICKQLENGARNAKKQIYGFPLNFTYTDFDRMWTEIKNTGICSDIQKKEIDEIVIAVQCLEYGNYIVSVWVFIAILYDESLAR